MTTIKFQNPVWLSHTVINTPGAGFYLIKETLKTLGWTAQSSGDGTATYNASADCLTHSGTGAGGTNNPTSWIRLMASGSTRELTIQLITNSVGVASTDSQFEITYARTGTFTTGTPSATQRPIATDERYMIGSGSAALPRGIKLFNWYNSAPICMWGGGDKNSPFGFYFAGCSTDTTYAVVHGLAMMPVDGIPLDPDPYVFYASGDGTDVYYWSVGEMFGQSTVGLAVRIRTWARVGTLAADWIGGGATGWWNGTAGIPEDFNSSEIYGAVGGAIQVLHTLRHTSFGEPKGWNRIAVLNTGPQQTNSDLLKTYNLSGSNDLIRVSAFSMPWNGTIPTVLPYVNGGAIHLWSADANHTGSGNSNIVIFSGSYDSVKPLINIISPSAGSTITDRQPITFDVTDNSGSFARILVHAGYSGIPGVEGVHDGERFNARHYSGSTNVRTSISNGYRYVILRDTGWPGDISLTPFVVDESGNENS